MTYENTPHPDIDAALTAEDGAKLAGLSVGGFKNAMSKLNKAGHDLRAPAQPGIRARRYDVDKLTAWIEAGKTIPGAADPTDENTQAVQATAQHVNGIWSATLETGETVTGKTIRALQSNADALASQVLGLPANQVRVQFDIQAPGTAGDRWAEAARKNDEGQKLLSQATEERHAVIAELRTSGGFTQDDIAAILGISQQRVTQYLQGTTKS
ncbi:helix-turn-helix domain-containing protein [Paenarthrobacter sp. NPDC090522]|uniref:helix-turn-helix domain-containing protein n=1 Tax=Paenarthrobacter sp. NPDC090522 TaxID=3364383 RepID=UPI00381770EC